MLPQVAVYRRQHANPSTIAEIVRTVPAKTRAAVAGAPSARQMTVARQPVPLRMARNAAKAQVGETAYCPFLVSRSPSASAAFSHSYWPDFVRPNHRSPSKWYMPLLEFTQTTRSPGQEMPNRVLAYAL